MYYSSYDIPAILRAEPDALGYVSSRLEAETFPHVKSLTLPAAKQAFKSILRDYLTGQLAPDQAAAAVEHQVQVSIRPVAHWNDRLLRTEASKIFTLGYGDYLLAQGEEFCFVPHSPHDESMECAGLIAGKKFRIRDIQKNIYANYGLPHPMHPTVPLHPNYRHVIVRVTE